MKRLLLASLALSACSAWALIDSFKYETKEVSNSAEFIQALQDAAATNALYTYGRYICTFELHPGTYDVSSLAMHSSFHISLAPFYKGKMIGLGEKPEDVTITGGGQGAQHPLNVMYATSGSFESFVVSNLTITGGYGTDVGGGIYGGDGKRTKVIDCILEGNHSGNMGGGAYGVTLERCIVRNNTAATRGGGAATSDSVDCQYIGNHVTVSKVSTTGGGAVCWGRHTRCLLKDNTSSADAGGALAPDAMIDCVFDSNYADAWYMGGHARMGSYTNCVFRNNDSRVNPNYIIGSVVYETTLSGCIITNNAGTHYMVSDTSMDRCYYGHNFGLQENARPVNKYDSKKSNPIFTNCIFEGNDNSNGGWATIIGNCDVINCTFVKNAFEVYPNFGAMPCGGRVVNCVFQGNTPYDVTDAGGQMSGGNTAVTNCFWETEWGGNYGPKAGTYVGGGKVADLKLKGDRHIPAKDSPAFNAGYMDDDLMALVNPFDFYRRQRYAMGGLDAGAVERQEGDSKALVIMVR